MIDYCCTSCGATFPPDPIHLRGALCVQCVADSAGPPGIATAPSYNREALRKPEPEYCYITCEECGCRELATLGHHHCIICNWRLTGEDPRGEPASLLGIRAACDEAERSADEFLRKILTGLCESGYSVADIHAAFQKL